MAATNPYRQLWRVVDGAVTDCFKNHPDYLSKSGRKFAQGSLVKRLTGTVLSFAVQQTARGRIATAETGQGAVSTSAPKAVGAITTSTVLSPRTTSSFWVRRGYSRYHKSGLFASKCAQLQREIEIGRLCLAAVEHTLFVADKGGRG